MATFMMMVGIPGSGKSTWAKEMASQEENTIWLSSDNIREELYGTPQEQKNPKRVFKILNERTCQALKEGKSVIYDATNLLRARRVAVVNMVKQYDPLLLCCFCNPTVDVAIERAKNHRERPVPEAVIRRMYAQLEDPGYNEGWADIFER